MKKNELVIVGDVIKSRRKFEPGTWKHFHESIERINHTYEASLTIPFSIYSGDSFGAVCKDLSTAVEIIIKLQNNQRHHKSRIILIEDEITFGLDKNSFLTLEGPALWKSEEVMKELKKKQTIYFAAQLKDTWASVTIETVINLLLTLKSNWKKIEWDIYDKYTSDETQIKLATKMGYTQQYISKVIKNSNLYLVKETEKNLKPIINGIHNYVR